MHDSFERVGISLEVSTLFSYAIIYSPFENSFSGVCLLNFWQLSTAVIVKLSRELYGVESTT